MTLILAKEHYHGRMVQQERGLTHFACKIISSSRDGYLTQLRGLSDVDVIIVPGFECGKYASDILRQISAMEALHGKVDYVGDS